MLLELPGVREGNRDRPGLGSHRDSPAQFLESIRGARCPAPDGFNERQRGSVHAGVNNSSDNRFLLLVFVVAGGDNALAVVDAKEARDTTSAKDRASL